MTSPKQQSYVPDLETASNIILPGIDWKHRYEQLNFEHQIELERIRLHYDLELKDKLNGS